MNIKTEILKILLVEDNEGDARLFRVLLNENSSGEYSLTLANDLKSAKEYLRENIYNLLILDLNLPDSTGPDTFTEINSVAENIPVVVLTGHSDRELGKQIIQQGAEDYLSKNDLSGELNVKTIRFAIERFKINNEIKEKERNLNILVQKDPNAIFVLSNSGIIRFINPAGEVLLGKTSEQLLNTQFQISLSNLAEAKIFIDNPVKGKRIAIPALTNAKWSGKDSLILTLQDITEKIESEEKFKTLFHASPDMLIIQDYNSMVLEVNYAITRTIGYTREELLNKGVSGFIKDEDENEVNKVRELLERKGKAVYERVLISKRKKLIPVEISSAVINYMGSKAVLSLARDVTQRKIQEQKIIESEERFRGFFENSPVGMYRTTPDGTILNVNPAILGILGYSSFEELVNEHKAYDSYADPSDKKRFDEIIKNEGVIFGFESKWIGKDGRIIDIRESAKSVFDDNHNVLYYEGTAVDITNEKQAELQMRESEKQFRSVWENSFDGMRLTDANGNLVDVNKAYCKLFRMEKKELVGKPFSVVYIDKDDVNIENFKNNFLAGNIKPQIEGELNVWNGEVRWFSLSNSFINIGEKKSLLLSIFRDISERKRYETDLMEAKQKAENADRLKSEFLAQMSHEIRTPMNVIISTLELLEDDLNETENSEIIESLDMMDSAGKRLVKTVDSILNMSLIQVGQYQSTPKELKFTEHILEPLQREYRTPIAKKQLAFEIINNTSDDIVFADEYSIYQIFSNLMDNAVKYTNRGSIKITMSDSDPEHLKVSISDTGIGIAEEFLQNLFTPFIQEEHGYSRAYDGSGLGLSLVDAYCVLNDIEKNVESVKGEGTTFFLKIPKREET